ncbi:molecular chaperone DnaK [Bifidobacterium goeldii]|uniref:Molecular chaperone DnaK n=1 Tax=Bifidobacterium goeldii TaxID=2306975 RepID=A0A430FNA6_9BIFI|nr:molecular chaperone DnaK [Bifidobacterium goeldii]
MTVLRIENLNFEVLGTDGDRNLGGYDFDNELMKLIAADVARQGGEGLLDDFVATADLREKAEMAKRALSNVAKTNVFITFQGKNYKVTVSRQDFEKATASLLNRTRDLVEDVLDETNLTWDGIDYVLLIGGSTRMPMVREMVTKMSGKTPETNVNPDEAVALGASIQAALEVANGGGTYAVDDPSAPAAPADPSAAPSAGTVVPGVGKAIVIQDVTSQALGTLTYNPETDKQSNAVVIPRNSKIPGSYSEDFYTVADNQTEIRIQVTQGDDPDPNFVVILGESTLRIPPYPAESPIRVTYHYDIDQTVQIEVTDLVSGQSLGMFEIDRAANMDDAQVAAATDKISRMTVE